MELINGRIEKAKKVCLYGIEGIGKSTIAAKFPSPIFIDVEGSTSFMDVVRTPEPSSFAMLMEQVKYFTNHSNELRTLVIDTADWAERLCTSEICSKFQVGGIEDIGYGKGYVYVYERFGELLNLLTTLCNHGVNIVIIAHAQMRKFEQPDEMGSYDRWELKLGKKTSSLTSPLLKEWSDLLLFVNYKTYVTNVDNQGAAKGKNKAQGGKTRVMYTTHYACWDAKNRFGLAEELPFDYAQIAHLFDNIPVPSKPVQPAQPMSPPPPKPEAASQPATQRPATSVQQPIDDTPILPPPTDQSNLDEDGIPQALLDLMHANDVKPHDIRFVVGSKGYYPSDTPIRNYANDFINGVLISAWPQVLEAIKKNQVASPFNK